MLTVLIIANTVFNIFFGVVCGMIAFTMIKNNKAVKKQFELKSRR